MSGRVLLSLLGMCTLFCQQKAEAAPWFANVTGPKSQPPTRAEKRRNTTRPVATPAKTATPATTTKPTKTGPCAKAEVFLFLAPIKVLGGSGASIGHVLTRLAQSKLQRLSGICVKTQKQMPRLPALLASYGRLDKLDRVSLIAIKNRTGFDGVIQLSYRLVGDRLRLDMRLTDFRNGEPFIERKLQRALDAKLFSLLEQDLVDFARRIRRSYHVTLEVRSSPPGSRVSVNGRDVGVTPLIRELSAGSYTVRVTRKGYKPYRRRVAVSNGDRLLVEATLYNPLATRFLNAKPGFRVDSRQLNVGYRYVYAPGHADVSDHVHLFSAEALLRLYSFDVGLRFSATNFQSAEQIDSFAGGNLGRNEQDHKLIMLNGLVKYVVWEKFSFASLRLVAAPGLTFSRSDSGKHNVSRWSFSVDGYAELITRLARSGNFSLELAAGLGISYLGNVPVVERSFTPFGSSDPKRGSRHLVGPLASLSLRFNFFNGIF
jgi:hypothetical protein